ncbi:hypothetical protein [Streptomyces sp. NPDC001292]|uniref:hypothetical protein n=1 Tax=Streptomyces sp. NPDC001292 TaxID=3364558 RepID=UPI00367D21F5
MARRRLGEGCREGGREVADGEGAGGVADTVAVTVTRTGGVGTVTAPAARWCGVPSFE